MAEPQSTSVVLPLPEEWRPVVGYEGDYEVAATGLVRRVGRGHGVRSGRLVAQRIGFGGYPVVRLNNKRVGRTYYLHRLVALAFVGPCPDGCEINHKDRDRTNPRADNLEYVTHSENLKHAFRNGGTIRRGVQKLHHKLTENDVREIRKSALTSRQLGAIYGVGHSTILAIRAFRKWSHVV